MDTFECVKSVLLKKIRGLKEITVESTFESLGLDSMETVDFVLNLEEIFDITFDDEDFLKINTIQDVLNLIDSKKHRGGSLC